MPALKCLIQEEVRRLLEFTYFYLVLLLKFTSCKPTIARIILFTFYWIFADICISLKELRNNVLKLIQMTIKTKNCHQLKCGKMKCEGR